MCAATVTRKINNCFKTSYDCAHYYENLPDKCPSTKPSSTKARRRPDLYVYDPIINEKQSTYRQCYEAKKSIDRESEKFGKVYYTSKHTLKNLFDEFHNKPVKTLTYNDTSSGLEYIDPGEKVGTKLLNNFYNETSKIQINSSFNEHDFPIFYLPYVSTSHSVHKYLGRPGLKNFDSDDDFTDQGSEKKEAAAPPTKQVYDATPRVFFKVPFGGDASVYTTDFTDPAKKPAYLSNVWLIPKPETVD